MMKKTNKSVISKETKLLAPVPEALSPLKNSAVVPSSFTKTLAMEIVKNISSFGKLSFTPFRKDQPVVTSSEETPFDHPIYVDTSVFIDGRIVPIVNSGFLAGTLVIPRFILGELQHIADSDDVVRRTKGRRGLEAVQLLQKQKSNTMIQTVVVDDDVPTVTEADHKLVALSRAHHARLLTLDFNLAHLARAQGVSVVNINDLSNALKVALIPGESLKIHIAHAGKERKQGVGYLSDGTMVVVEDTQDRIGQEVSAVVVKVHQTPAGQLFFGRLQ